MPLDLFSKTRIPENFPEEMQRVIDELKNSQNQEDCLRKVFELLSEKYSAERTKTFTKFPEVFIRDLENLWNKKGFLHCTNINYLARILLIKSGFFKEDDIKIKWTQVWLISPHQYLQVNIGNSWTDVDIWGKSHGIEFGNHAHTFNQK